VSKGPRPYGTPPANVTFLPSPAPRVFFSQDLPCKSMGGRTGQTGLLRGGQQLVIQPASPEITQQYLPTRLDQSRSALDPVGLRSWRTFLLEGFAGRVSSRPPGPSPAAVVGPRVLADCRWATCPPVNRSGKQNNFDQTPCNTKRFFSQSRAKPVCPPPTPCHRSSSRFDRLRRSARVNLCAESRRIYDAQHLPALNIRPAAITSTKRPPSPFGQTGPMPQRPVERSDAYFFPSGPITPRF